MFDLLLHVFLIHENIYCQKITFESVKGFLSLLIALQIVRRCYHFSLELLVFSHQLSKIQNYSVCKKWQTITLEKLEPEIVSSFLSIETINC